MGLESSFFGLDAFRHTVFGAQVWPLRMFRVDSLFLLRRVCVTEQGCDDSVVVDLCINSLVVWDVGVIQSEELREKGDG